MYSIVFNFELNPFPQLTNLLITSITYLYRVYV
jgi:hypothetical protein